MCDSNVIHINDDMGILPAKNPETCGYSVDLGGVYICKLGAIPCVRLKLCAVSQSELVAKALTSDSNESPKNESGS